MNILKTENTQLSTTDNELASLCHRLERSLIVASKVMVLVLGLTFLDF